MPEERQPHGIVLTDVLPDGSTDHEATVEYVVGDLETGDPYLDDAGQPLAVITIRPLTTEKRRVVYKRHTKRVPNPKTGAMVEESDGLAAADELIQWTILNWRGLYSKDGQELPCTPQTKLKLSIERRADILRVATQNEQVGREASFRQPSDVV